MQTDRLCKLLRKCIWLCQLSPCLMCHRCQRGPGSRKETKFTDSLYSPGCVFPLDKGGIHNLTPFYSMQTLATLIADIFSVWDSRCRPVHRASCNGTFHVTTGHVTPWQGLFRFGKAVQTHCTWLVLHSWEKLACVWVCCRRVLIIMQMHTFSLIYIT